MPTQPPNFLDPVPQTADELDVPSPAAEPRPHVWRGLGLGLALAIVAWILLAAVGVTLYALFA